MRRIGFQSQPRQIFQENLCQNTPTEHGAGRVAQVVECLHSTRNAVIGNPSTAKIKLSTHINCTNYGVAVIFTYMHTPTLHAS
jgi:hypothetical protein